MKAKKKTKKKERLLFKDVFIIQPNWVDIEDYTEEEIEDMLEENHIPEISYIDMIEKPEEIRFD
ncbi:MAG: hypothetical protein MUO34_06820 [Ignavibacteriaceae bacterium]|nr:hypothetical protein [Ignavibacteriaceae bacterium]